LQKLRTTLILGPR